MTTLKDIAAGRTDIFKLGLADLHIKEGWNARDMDFNPDDDDDMALARSIKENGIKETLTVAIGDDGKAYVTNGHRRRAAALYAVANLDAKIEFVPVQTEGRGSDEVDQVLSMVTRNSGKALKPLELGRVYKKLMALGLDEDKIADRVGRSRQHVVGVLELQSAPVEIKEMVQQGEVSATLAADVIRGHEGDKAAATETLKQGVANAKAKGKTKATKKNLPPLPAKNGKKVPAVNQPLVHLSMADKAAGLTMEDKRRMAQEATEKERVVTEAMPKPSTKPISHDQAIVRGIISAAKPVANGFTFGVVSNAQLESIKRLAST